MHEISFLRMDGGEKGGVDGHSAANNSSPSNISNFFFEAFYHVAALLNGLWRENKYDRCVE